MFQHSNALLLRCSLNHEFNPLEGWILHKEILKSDHVQFLINEIVLNITNKLLNRGKKLQDHFKGLMYL